jgi:5-methylcytosine-specific restriction endonuclease McrA
MLKNIDKTHCKYGHEKPLASGFGLSRDNAVLLCRMCNAQKGKKMPDEFYSKRELDRLKFFLKNLDS